MLSAHPQNSGLSLVIFSIFLINVVSAVVVTGKFSNGNPSEKTINYGEAINIETTFSSMHPPTKISVTMYDSSGEIIYPFLDTSISSYSYGEIFPITQNIYKNSGTYTIKVFGKDDVGEIKTVILYLTVNPAPDTTPPVITLLGDNPVSIEVGTPYIDAGATATDNIDGDITDKITTTNSVNVNILGTYTVVYSVQDNAGNSATQVTRTVNVIEGAESNTAPEIISTATTEVNEGYDYNYQIIATDAEDDTLTYSLIENPTWLSINSDGLVTGTAPEVSYNTDYQVTISVSDGQDSDTESYTLTVKDTTQPPEPDTTSPEITIISPENGKTYTSPIDELHFTVTDEHLNSCLVNDNPISCNSGVLTTIAMTSLEGENTWTVYAVDDYGNEAEVTVTFTIDTSEPDTEAPEITILSPQEAEYNDNIVIFKVITNEDAVVEFSLDGDANIEMDNPDDHIFIFTVTALSNGTHNIVFSATDTADNTATKSVVFSVKTKDKKSGTTNLNYQGDSFYEQLYLDQFKPKTIYLGEEPEEKQFSWFQRFINWLKRLFGLK